METCHTRRKKGCLKMPVEHLSMDKMTAALIDMEYYLLILEEHCHEMRVRLEAAQKNIEETREAIE